MEEREAIARLKRGDVRGLETLVRTHQVKAVRTAFLITQDRAQAEDIVQAAFVRAYERIDQFDAARPFGPWFLRSVVNDAIKAAQWGARHVSLEATTGEDATLADVLPDPNPGPVDLIEAAQTREALRDSLARLPRQQRAVIVMRYFLGMSEAEMSETLDTPPGTVKWRLHAARKRLRALLTGADVD